jgi:hypothetical protein
MRKILGLFFIAIIFVACKSENNEQNAENQQVKEFVKVNLADFDSVAANYVGDTIEVTGFVDHVCKHGGKKILLVEQNGDATLHIESEERFEDTLTGTEVTVIGIVDEFVVDEQYCQQLENEEIGQHSEGENKEDMIEQRKKQAQFFRDSMQKAGVDHLSFYSLKFVDFK